MKTFAQIAAEITPHITEMMPWDVEEYLQAHPETLIVDIRETHEYDTMHIADSLNVPRGILENACEWDFEETEPELVEARHRPVVLVCRSGNRSALAAYTLQQMGYENVISLKTGLRGWSDYELPLVDLEENPVDIEDADHYFANKILPEQRNPASRQQ
ncbi:rhodanese-like domain-containing protein [Thiolapillus brandeum]|uniref:Rhodanese domain protein n=1 Tax=Thiolapillus brandeum TaxID=1076588 RepID=A0A7U6JI19_9GAMM|nr:rhodanese-like domain-containing protein [Thiolapillus brandeum]BAO45069.1 rhodanese domain protein [Thiolapillus brandeum]